MNAFFNAIGVKLFYFEISFIISFYLGLPLFFLRAIETDLYLKIGRLICRNTNRNLGQGNYFMTSSKSFKNDTESLVETSTENMDEVYFELNNSSATAIHKTINLEFMCCILYGLTEIYSKQEKGCKSYAFNKPTESNAIEFIETELEMTNGTDNTLYTNRTREVTRYKLFIYNVQCIYYITFIFR